MARGPLIGRFCGAMRFFRPYFSLLARLHGPCAPRASGTTCQLAAVYGWAWNIHYTIFAVIVLYYKGGKSAACAPREIGSCDSGAYGLCDFFFEWHSIWGSIDLRGAIDNIHNKPFVEIDWLESLLFYHELTAVLNL